MGVMGCWRELSGMRTGIGHGGVVGYGQWTNMRAWWNIRPIRHVVPAWGLKKGDGVGSYRLIGEPLLGYAFSALVSSSNILSLTLLILAGAVFGDVAGLIVEIAYSIIICCCHHSCFHCADGLIADGVV